MPTDAEMVERAAGEIESRTLPNKAGAWDDLRTILTRLVAEAKREGWTEASEWYNESTKRRDKIVGSSLAHQRDRRYPEPKEPTDG